MPRQICWLCSGVSLMWFALWWNSSLTLRSRACLQRRFGKWNCFINLTLHSDGQVKEKHFLQLPIQALSICVFLCIGLQWSSVYRIQHDKLCKEFTTKWSTYFYLYIIWTQLLFHCEVPRKMYIFETSLKLFNSLLIFSV